MTAKFFQDIFSVIKAERFVWATVVQLFSFVGIDVVHHQSDVRLGQTIKISPFGKDTADQLMVDLDRTFLVRAAGITIKDICAAV